MSLAFLGAAAAPAQFSLKKLKKAVDTATDVAEEVDRFTFDEQEEIELGLAISRRIIGRYGVVRDLEATRYLSLVGSAVARDTDRPSLPWQWIILDSDAINAFAAPGGYVHVTRGALAVIESEAELAGVLAHEAAHIVRKHTIKGLQKSMGTELAKDQATYTVGSAFFNEVADQAAQAVLAGFGRAEELEADEVGAEIATRVGYATKGLSHFLGTLTGMHSNARGASILYRSHPETQERIQQLDQWMRQRGLEGGVWQAERYARWIAYETSESSTGDKAAEGARGVAGGSETADQESEDEAEEKDQQGFSLAQLSNPFEMGEEDDSAEVTGAGAGRAVGEEEGEVDGGPKEIEPLVIRISENELEAFLVEGGLK